MAERSLFHILGLLTALLTLLLDQVSKHYFLSVMALPGREAVEVTSFFNLVAVWNYGVSFGMFAHTSEMTRLILIAIALCISAVLYIWLRRAESKMVAASLGLAIGGALGNVVDRVRFGAVFDFLDFHLAGYHWPAFNIADSAICIGVFILCAHQLFSPRSS